MSAVVERAEHPVVAANPMQLLQTALDKGASIEQMQQLMDLQERWEANNARKAFAQAISAAKSEIKPIAKKRAVDFTSSKGRTNYQYEDLALVAEEVDPILSKYGLSYRYRSKQEANRLEITCILAHCDGHFEETMLAAANDDTGNKNSIQAIGSTATYLQRYTLKLALGLSAGRDDDGRGAAAPKTDVPEGYEKWKADMTAVTDEGFAKLESIWAKSNVDFKNFTVKHDLQWWNESKARARKVQS